MSKQIKLTTDGLKKLQEELDFLKSEKRKEIAEKIKVALSFGDLSENSEYDEAKNDQARIESRIQEIENSIKYAQVIDESHLSSDIVSLGSTIVVLDVEYDEEQQYKLVGSAEADPKNGKISDESPIGKAVIGRKVGETVAVAAPKGDISYTIIKIV